MSEWVNSGKEYVRDTEFGRIRVAREPVAWHNHKFTRRAFGWVALDENGILWTESSGYAGAGSAMKEADRAIQNGMPFRQYRDVWVECGPKTSLFRFGNMPCHHCGGEGRNSRRDGNVFVNCCKSHEDSPCPRHESDHPCFECTAVATVKVDDFPLCGHEKCLKVLRSEQFISQNREVWYGLTSGPPPSEEYPLDWTGDEAVDQHGTRYVLTTSRDGATTVTWDESPMGPAGRRALDKESTAKGLAQNWSMGRTVQQVLIVRSMERMD